ncbi:hypothetical protein SAMN05421823_104180 [Catalinimonas alkaloidigena]|uniref:Uncharacterized protein n=1 Tax=Catalinimonas alkaloidigena TaxID=1075417 RepID=A0A1G9GQN4_9BACT|nr:hypothetical protein [Catalinimonas alkaloidigena]SDL02825.1 hypothetical protein SAMN05421823_104180 [Catalinimonas alkaloidigena]
MLALFSAVALLVSACEEPIKTSWVYYAETGCDDPWPAGTSDEETKANLVKYLSQYEIPVYKIAIHEGEACDDCSCDTGRKFRVEINRKSEEEALQIGFQELPEGDAVVYGSMLQR